MPLVRALGPRSLSIRTVVGCLGLLASWLACVPFAVAQQRVLPKNSIVADTATADYKLRLYLSPIRVDSGYRLTPYSYSGATHVEQTVDFAERTDSAHEPVVGVLARTIDTRNAVWFVSPALAGPFELSGLFSGRLDLITNGQDFNFQISLYELRSNGDYALISTYSSRPGATAEPSNPPSLQPGVRQHLDYRSGPSPNRVIQHSSRLVAVITILKHVEMQTAYATGRDVSDGRIAYMKEPVKISWYGESYIELQVKR